MSAGAIATESFESRDFRGTGVAFFLHAALPFSVFLSLFSLDSIDRHMALLSLLLLPTLCLAAPASLLAYWSNAHLDNWVTGTAAGSKAAASEGYSVTASDGGLASNLTKPPPGTGTIPMYQYYSESLHDHALTASAVPPSPAYKVRPHHRLAP